MLRALVVLLLLANGLYFGWAQGWLGPPPRHAEHEPERLAAQVQPQTVQVLPAGTATAAVQAARAAAQVCLEAGPVPENALATAEAALIVAQVPDGVWQRVSAPPAPVWLVYAGRYPEAPLRNLREEDLRKQKLEFEMLTSPPELAPGFVLSRQPSREAAQSWLDANSTPALRGVRLVQLPNPPPNWRLRVARADPDLAERLKALPAEPLGGGFRPCAAKP
jgi:hypothetical protein